eukprot:18014_6
MNVKILSFALLPFLLSFIIFQYALSFPVSCDAFSLCRFHFKKTIALVVSFPRLHSFSSYYFFSYFNNWLVQPYHLFLL